MYKRQIFGYRTLDRSPLKALPGNGEGCRQSSKSIYSQTGGEVFDTNPKPFGRDSVDKKKLVPLTKNVSVGVLGSAKQARLPSGIGRQSQSSACIQPLFPGSMENSLVHEGPRKGSVRQAQRASNQHLVSASHSNVFERLSAGHRVSLSQSKSKFGSKPASEKDHGDESALTLQVKSSAPASKPVPVPTSPFTNTNEFLLHEYQLENVKQRASLEAMKVELDAVREAEERKAAEASYLTTKTLEMGATMAKQEAELIAVRHQLLLVGQAAQQARQQNTETQQEVNRTRLEFDELRVENQRLISIMNDERAERDRILRRMTEKDLSIQNQATNMALLEKERVVLIGLVERLKAELGALRESNKEAMHFLLKTN